MKFNNQKYANEINFDLEKVDQLIQLGKDLNEDVLSQLLRVHFETSEVQLHEIKQWSLQNKFLYIRAGAHKMKSSCGTLGLNKLHRLCADLERYLTETSTISGATVNAFVEGILKEYQYSKSLINQFNLKLGG